MLLDSRLRGKTKSYCLPNPQLKSDFLFTIIKKLSLESVAAQEALNLTLFVEHGYPVLTGNDWQVKPFF